LIRLIEDEMNRYKMNGDIDDERSWINWYKDPYNNHLNLNWNIGISILFRIL
jgi:hypothetical protein